MQFIEGKDRDQIVLYSDTLNQIIERDNEVRVIDAFVEGINLADFGFKIKTSREGAPAYHPKDLLRLFVYGYIHEPHPLLAAVGAGMWAQYRSDVAAAPTGP